jgi:hypothetical protein
LLLLHQQYLLAMRLQIILQASFLLELCQQRALRCPNAAAPLLLR